MTSDPVGLVRNSVVRSGISAAASGELLREKPPYLLRGYQGVEAVFSFVGKEQGTRKAAVQVGQGDKHIQSPGPDMQSVGRHPVRSVRSGRNGQFLVTVGQVLLGEVESPDVHHGGSNGRSGAVDADDPFGPQGMHVIGRVIPDVQYAGTEFQPGTPGVEMKPYTVLPLRGVHQGPVQFSAGDGIDDLFVFLAVRLKAEVSFQGMDHPSRHGDGHFEDFILESDLVQGVDAPDGHGQVDRPASAGGFTTDIGPLFVHFDPEPPPGEEDRQQRPGKTAAHQGNGFSEASHWRFQGVRDGPPVNRPYPSLPP